jgi:hypothetical protein
MPFACWSFRSLSWCSIPSTRHFHFVTRAARRLPLATRPLPLDSSQSPDTAISTISLICLKQLPVFDLTVCQSLFRNPSRKRPPTRPGPPPACNLWRLLLSHPRASRFCTAASGRFHFSRVSLYTGPVVVCLLGMLRAACCVPTARPASNESAPNQHRPVQALVPHCFCGVLLDRTSYLQPGMCLRS